MKPGRGPAPNGPPCPCHVALLSWASFLSFSQVGSHSCQQLLGLAAQPPPSGPSVLPRLPTRLPGLRDCPGGALTGVIVVGCSLQCPTRGPHPPLGSPCASMQRQTVPYVPVSLAPSDRVAAEGNQVRASSRGQRRNL